MNESPANKEKRPGCSCAADGRVEGCYHHDPKRAEDRKKNAKHAATVKADKEVRGYKEHLVEIAAKVERGDLTPPQGNSIARIYSVMVELTLLERGIYREQALIMVKQNRAA
jgi:hypothetical protein